MKGKYDFDIGAKGIWKKDFIIYPGDIQKSAKEIGDINPLHNNPVVAKEMGFEDIIAPGVMTIGFVSATIAEIIPMAIVLRLEEVDFLNPLYEGSVVQVVCTILKQKKQIVKVKAEVYSSSVAIMKGYCLLLIPQKQKQQLKEPEKECAIVI